MGGALLQIIWRSVSKLLQTVKRSEILDHG
jgi:hypothetical protein